MGVEENASGGQVHHAGSTWGV